MKILVELNWYESFEKAKKTLKKLKLTLCRNKLKSNLRQRFLHETIGE